MVGALEDMRFDEAELTLHSGDLLYLYTDGVNEAMDENDQLFGNARTREVLLKFRLSDCISLVSGMTDELAKFTQNAEQSDDITMLALRYFGPNSGI